MKDHLRDMSKVGGKFYVYFKNQRENFISLIG